MSVHEAQTLVLVVSADPRRAKRVQDMLTELHCQAYAVSRAAEAAVLLSSVRFDLAVLDWESADAAALKLYGEIGMRGIAHLVLLPPGDALRTPPIHDLSGGKMELFSEPLGTETIRAAVQKLLGASFPGQKARHLRVGDFVFDPVTYDAFWMGRAIKLPPVEFRLLQLFLRHEGKTLARQFIFESVWPDGGYEMGRMVDVHVSNLRRALAQTVRAAKINAIKGHGYCLTLGRQARATPTNGRRGATVS